MAMAPFAKWHGVQVVNPPCFGPWHVRHVFPRAPTKSLFGWQLVHGRLACGPPASGKNAEWSNG